jgi:hypothetical protein
MTDGMGQLTFPGLGSGRWRITETKPNPKYVSPGEVGGSDSRIIDLGQASTSDLQVFENDLISISVQVDKDTIRKTSAAYRSLEGEEGIDNTGQETYHYDIDYRSTASVQADEFLVDDPMEAVSEGRIRLRELWTAVAWGDCDGLMNVWYKTNRTDDQTDYANASAMSSNPFNPNNPAREAVYPNTGFKLWAQDLPADARTHLSVDDLGLEKDEYVTAVRYEYGAVMRGFTTKNYADASLNGEHHEGLGIVGDTVDWTPVPGEVFYTQGAADATGLKPVTYLVSCPEALGEDVRIVSSATARIARNRILLDEDRDEVCTIPIGTFTVAVKPDTPATIVNGYYGINAPQTGDAGGTTFPRILFPILCVGLIAGIIALCFAQTRRLSMRLCSVALVGVMAGGLVLASVAGGVNPFAGIFANGDGSVRNISHPKTVSLTSAGSEGTIAPPIKPCAKMLSIFANMSDAKIGQAEINHLPGRDSVSGEKAHSFTIDGDISAASWIESGGERNFAETTWVSQDGYVGTLALVSITAEPVYRTKEGKVDQTELLSDLTIEDISQLPEEKAFGLRSSNAVDATQEVVLKRAGLALTVTGWDADGIPNLWDAKIVYRGLESWLEVDYYKAHATYSGTLKASGANPQSGIGGSGQDVRPETGAGANNASANASAGAGAKNQRDASHRIGDDRVAGASSAEGGTSSHKGTEGLKKADDTAALGEIGTLSKDQNKNQSKDKDKDQNKSKGASQSSDTEAPKDPQGHASGKTDTGRSALNNSEAARSGATDTISDGRIGTDLQPQNGAFIASLQELWPFLLPVFIVLAVATVLLTIFMRGRKRRAADRH